jgi:peptidoglycan/xylan/chitin deacetylase (PgdA/CDA1 family)
VTVTFDFDGNTTDQLAAANILQSLGMQAVFYVNSGRLDTGGEYLSTGQVRSLQDGGNEIGGHTVSHVRLSDLDATEQQRQICADRSALLAAGFKVSSFASPYADLEAPAQTAAQTCGYNNARTIGGLSCRGCDAAETVPPALWYRTRSVSGLRQDTTSGQLTVAVQRAQATGGWLQFVFTRVCVTAPCATNGINLSEFEAFARWLDGQRRAGGITIATVHDVLGGNVRPAVAAPPATATVQQITNAGFENVGPTPDAPQCYSTVTNAADNTFTSRRSADRHSGAWAQEIVVTKVTGAVKLQSAQDLGSCAPPITAHHAYRVAVWYKSTAPIELVASTRRPTGGYSTFGGSTAFPAVSQWTEASWTTKGAPSTENLALSVGILFKEAGTYLIDDFTITDAGVAPQAESESSTVDSDLSDGSGPQDLFVPSDIGPTIPAGPAAATLEANQHYGLLLTLEIIGALVLMWLLVVALDRRFRQIHRRTRNHAHR